ncbi:hypothetical protein KAR91_36260 [Candidatus Pacearchaeota archaeon]|nr:hypothetical protein [Candidatus Pacearchaeota archaeon]
MSCPFDAECEHFNAGQGIKEHCVACRKKEENLEGLRPKKRKLLMFSVSKENQRTLIRRVAKRLPVAQGKYINAMLDGCSSREIAVMYGIKDSSDVRKTIRRALKNIEKLME